MCWYILAINHEDEISIYSRGGKKHNHEFLPYTAQPVCLRGTIQCKQQNNLRKPHIQIHVLLKKYSNKEGNQGMHKPAPAETCG